MDARRPYVKNERSLLGATPLTTGRLVRRHGSRRERGGDRAKARVVQDHPPSPTANRRRRGGNDLLGPRPEPSTLRRDDPLQVAAVDRAAPARVDLDLPGAHIV